jgi:hypothetical protein
VQLARPGRPPEAWVALPFAAIGLTPRDDALYVLPGGGRIPGYGRLDWSKRVLVMVTPTTPAPLSGTALLPRSGDVLLAHSEGRVYSLRDDRAEVFAEGFTFPTSLAEDAQGSVFVANFGGDSVSRVLP